MLFIGEDMFLVLFSYMVDVVVLGFEMQDFGCYGCLVIGFDGLEKIVEFKDVDEVMCVIRLVNLGVFVVDVVLLWDLLLQIGNDNVLGEYYLIDIFVLVCVSGCWVEVVICDEVEMLGINICVELVVVEVVFQICVCVFVFEDGVMFSDLVIVWFVLDMVIGCDVIIGQNVVFGFGVMIESGVEILFFCYLEGCYISVGVIVGFFVCLCFGVELGGDVYVGNFVEIKNLVLDEGVKVGYLIYLGDVYIGECMNIGVGMVICNYDGVFKYKMEIGVDVFIGLDIMLVVLVCVGVWVMMGLGLVIIEDIFDDVMVIVWLWQVMKFGFVVWLMQVLCQKKGK